MEAFDALSEALTYIDTDSFGFFSILHADGQTKAQRSYSLDALSETIEALDTGRDTWISQAVFRKPNRRAVNLLNSSSLFVDLDIYNSDFVGWSTDHIVESILWWCGNEAVPYPSHIVFSGRGLQAKWIFDKPIPRHALPRWNACESQLCSFLQQYGADTKAKDISRVLRVVGTVNTKSGETCRVCYENTDRDGQPTRYDFEYLCECILPYDRHTLEQQRKERDAKRAEKKKLKAVKGGKQGHLRGFSGRTLAWHRLEDLRALAAMRGGIHEGERMQHLFWQINFLLLSGAVNTSTMYAEAAELARQIDPAWDYRSQELMTVYAKAKAHESGEKVEFGGKMYPPLYTPKNQTLIEVFQITPDEERKLKTIVSNGIAAERHKDRQTERRRSSGAIDRKSYLDGFKAQKTRAIELRQKGLSVREIAKEMGISSGAISKYIKPLNQ